MRRLAGLGLVVLIAVACSSPTASSPSASTGASASGAAGSGEASGTPYEINVILPLTGSGAFLGKPQQQALQVLESTFNKSGGIKGRPVKFIFYDDTTTPATDVQLANQIIAKKVPIIIGPSIVASCNAISPLLNNGPVMYCLSPGIHPDKGSYTFTSSVSTVDQNRALFKYFKSKGLTKVATLTSTDATGQDADNAIHTAQSETPGVDLVAQEHFTTTDVSVSAQITHVKASGAQVLVAWSTGTPIATVLRGVSQAGLDIPVATTDGNMTFAQMDQYASFLPKELLIPAPQWPQRDTIPAGAVKDKLTAYYSALQSQNVPTDIGPSLAWDPAAIVLDALAKLGPDATATRLRDYIAGLKGYAGINGVYDFTKEPQRGLTVEQTIVTHWDSAKKAFVPVSTP